MSRPPVASRVKGASWTGNNITLGRFVMPAKAKKKAVAKAKKGESFKCGVCGYRIIVDEACGCAEEHIFVCCDKPMKKKA
jgi:hypothetical protein